MASDNKQSREIVIGSATLPDDTVIINLGTRPIDIRGVEVPGSDFFLFERIPVEGKATKGDFFVQRRKLGLNKQFIDKLREFGEDAIIISNNDAMVMRLTALKFKVYWLHNMREEPVLTELVLDPAK